MLGCKGPILVLTNGGILGGVNRIESAMNLNVLSLLKTSATVGIFLKVGTLDFFGLSSCTN